MTTQRGASGPALPSADRRLDRRLATYAGDLEPLDDGTRRFLRTRLAAHRRAGRPALVLTALALLVLGSLVVGVASEDPARWQDSSTLRYLVVIALVQGAALLRHRLVRRADARLVAAQERRVARDRHVGLVTVAGRTAVLASAASAVLGVGWAAVLLVAAPGGLSAVWAACMASAVLTGALGLRRALDRPAVAVDAVSLAVDERMRAQEVSQLLMAPWFAWLAVFPVGADLPFWARKSLSATALAVVLLTLVAGVQRSASRPGTRW